MFQKIVIRVSKNTVVHNLFSRDSKTKKNKIKYKHWLYVEKKNLYNLEVEWMNYWFLIIWFEVY